MKRVLPGSDLSLDPACRWLRFSGRLPSTSSTRQLRIGISACCLAAAGTLLARVAVAYFAPELAFNDTQRLVSNQVTNLAIGALILLFGLLVLRWPARWENALGVPFAIAALIVYTTINLVNGTCNAGAQVAGALSAIFVTFYLTLPWAIAIGVMTVVSQQLIVWLTQPAAIAINDAIYIPIFLLLLTGLLAVARREQERIHAELRRQAQRDSVTGLATRQFLDTAIATVLAAQPDRSRICLVMVDLDNFKRVNDAHGHIVGDRALAEVSDRLRRLASPGDVAARVGGDELALLLHDSTPAQALAVAERLAEDVREIDIPVGNEHVRLSVSAGVGHVTDPTADVECLYVAADRELYRAKRAGRDQVSASQITLPDAMPRVHAR